MTSRNLKMSENDAHIQPVLQGFESPTFDNTHYRTFKKGTIFTFGHSNRSITEFIEKLAEYKIDRLVDVRTKPYSRRCPQFNRENMALSLAEHDINYDYRGLNLGGLGENVHYDETLRELCKLAANENIALCCSEADYKKCHRYTMITPDLLQIGLPVVHISY